MALGDVGLGPLSTWHAPGVDFLYSGGEDLALGTGEADSGTENSLF